jgi:hypothetical protein
MKYTQIKSALLHAWSIKTSSKWTSANPAKGQCSVTALVIQDIYGGELVKTRTPEGWHFYNIIDNKRLDFTNSQFAGELTYDDIPTGRREAFSDTSLVQYEELRKQLFRSLGLTCSEI